MQQNHTHLPDCHELPLNRVQCGDRTNVQVGLSYTLCRTVRVERTFKRLRMIALEVVRFIVVAALSLPIAMVVSFILHRVALNFGFVMEYWIAFWVVYFNIFFIAMRLERKNKLKA